MWIAMASFASPPSIQDLQELEWVGSATILPGAEEVLFRHGGWRFDVDAQPQGETRAGWSDHSELVVMNLASKQTRAFDVEASWAFTYGPRARLAHIGRDGEGGASLFVRSGEEVRSFGTGGAWPSDLRWDPSGEALYFLARAPVQDEDRDATWWTGGIREFDAPEPTKRLHRLDMSDGSIQVLTPEHLEVRSFALHPRGGPIALATAATANDYDAYFMASIQQLAADGSVTSLSEPGCAYGPAYSTDGKSLAWVGCGGGIHTDQLWVQTGGEKRDVVAGADLSLNAFDWTRRGLLIWTADGTRTGLHLLQNGKITKVPLSVPTLRSVVIARDGRWGVGIAESPSQKGELVRVDLKSGDVEKLFDPNPSWSEHALGTTEIVKWTSADGESLEGVLHRPAEGVLLKGLLVNPHGGPNDVSALTFGNGYHQAFTAAGYAVFQPNFRGGVGYGRGFYEANRGRIADIAFADIESGVDSLVEAGFDEGALFYGGWSFGGYLAAWTLGHTDRYRAIVSGGTISSRLVQYGMSSNTGRRAEFIFGGNPWTHREAFDRQDPNRFLVSASTPTLLLHGENDEATPLPHALILHRALKDLGVETKLYVYPREGHSGFDPVFEQHVLETWIGWMDIH